MAKKEIKDRKYKIGDRVVYKPKRTGNGGLDGMHGTVIYVDTQGACYTVEFDRPFYEGVTDYRARDIGIEPKVNRGWFCLEENLESEE